MKRIDAHFHQVLNFVPLLLNFCLQFLLGINISKKHSAPHEFLLHLVTRKLITSTSFERINSNPTYFTFGSVYNMDTTDQYNVLEDIAKLAPDLLENAKITLRRQDQDHLHILIVSLRNTFIAHGKDHNQQILTKIDEGTKELQEQQGLIISPTKTNIHELLSQGYSITLARQASASPDEEDLLLSTISAATVSSTGGYPINFKVLTGDILDHMKLPAVVKTVLHKTTKLYQSIVFAEGIFNSPYYLHQLDEAHMGYITILKDDDVKPIQQENPSLFDLGTFKQASINDNDGNPVLYKIFETVRSKFVKTSLKNQLSKNGTQKFSRVFYEVECKCLLTFTQGKQEASSLAANSLPFSQHPFQSEGFSAFVLDKEIAGSFSDDELLTIIRNQLSIDSHLRQSIPVFSIQPTHILNENRVDAHVFATLCAEFCHQHILKKAQEDNIPLTEQELVDLLHQANFIIHSNDNNYCISLPEDIPNKLIRLLQAIGIYLPNHFTKTYAPKRYADVFHISHTDFENAIWQNIEFQKQRRDKELQS